MKVQHSKCCVPTRHRGFESHPLRQYLVFRAVEGCRSG